jgi:hypothetical protein
MVLVFKIALIILVAAPVILIAFYLWFQIEEFARKKNRQENLTRKSESRRRRT